MRTNISRQALRSGVMLGFLALVTLCTSSCKDQIDAPIFGRLEVRLASPNAGGFEGGAIWLGDSLLVATVNRADYSFVLPVGTAQLRYEKECADVSPAGVVTIEIAPGATGAVLWDVLPSDGGIEVTSSMRGAGIILDGKATGRTTPATLECLEPGSHVVSVQLFGAGNPEPQTVMVGAGVVNVDFTLDPLPQSRGAIMEVVTATNCPNCGPVDAAAESLWTQSDIFGRGAFSVQIHTRWPPIADVFHTPSTLDRNLFYGDQERAGLPWRVTNGLTSARGAGNGNIPALIQSMRGEIEPFLDGTHGPTPVALYWRSSQRVAGQTVGGTLRVVLLATPEAPDDTEVLALDYKDNLVTFVAIHRRNETFYRVVRNFQSAGTLTDLGLRERGDWAELDFEFDISWDTEWSEEGMGMIALVQNLATKEVYQATHIGLP